LIEPAMTSADSRCTCVIPLRTAGSGPRLFMIHGVDGGIEPLRALVDRIGANGTIYGVRSQTLCANTPPLLTIEKMAAHYLDEITRVQVAGPYYLAGSSFGGMIAFEIARQLRAKGFEIAFLGMIDTPDMSYLKRRAKAVGIFTRVTEGVTQLRERIKEAARSGNVPAFVMDKVKARCMRMLYSAVPPASVSRLNPNSNAYDINWFAAVNYVPGTYDGRVSLFKTIAQSWDKRLPLDLGWGPLVSGDLEILEIPGDHVGIYTDPAVGILARHFDAVLEERS
jgi:thioesterase domain-containing protein